MCGYKFARLSYMTVQEKLDALKKEVSGKFEQFIFTKDRLKYFKSQGELLLIKQRMITKISNHLLRPKS